MSGAGVLERVPSTTWVYAVDNDDYAGDDAVDAEQLFGGEVINGALRDALYQWYEQRDLTMNLFGPFDIEAVRYARRIAAPTEADTAERHAAHRRGDCVDCLTEPHSAGRPRCSACQRVALDRLTRGNARRGASDDLGRGAVR